MTKQEFLETISEIVCRVNKRKGKPLFSSVVIAQAICESAWGQSQIMMKANAVFGIKASSNWKGKVYNANTKECYDGSTYTNINACFRAYNSLEESVEDYFNLICGNTRYKEALFQDTPFKCITEIKNGGYATSPTYIETIMSIINSNNLTRYDLEEIKVDIDKMVQDTLKGKYGNGEIRKQLLGKYYNEVQTKINSLYGKNTIEQIENEKIATEVIRGLWGNGIDRKTKLINAGFNYEAIQKIVNERLKR